MATVAQFEELLVWKEARVLTVELYRQFGNLKDFGFRDQIQRASVSIMNNIAEGFERGSDADFLRFLFIAKSSAGEVRSMIYLAEDLGYLSKEKSDELVVDLLKLSSGLSNFIKYLKRPKK